MNTTFNSTMFLSGEIDFVIEGIDEKLTFRAGDTYFLPARILHNETRVSEDYSVMQVYGPAIAATRAAGARSRLRRRQIEAGMEQGGNPRPVTAGLAGAVA